MEIDNELISQINKTKKEKEILQNKVDFLEKEMQRLSKEIVFQKGKYFALEKLINKALPY